MSTRPGNNHTFSCLKYIKQQILKEEAKSSKTFNHTIASRQFHRISSFSEQKKLNHQKKQGLGT